MTYDSPDDAKKCIADVDLLNRETPIQSAPKVQAPMPVALAGYDPLSITRRADYAWSPAYSWWRR